MKKKGLIVSRQIGSGRAFANWLAEAETNEFFDLAILSYPSSEKAFTEKNIPFESADPFGTQNTPYDFVFTGTSLVAEQDAAWIQWAKLHQIPVIAFIDQWINYKERFYNQIYPDYIFTVDQKARHSFLTETQFDSAKTFAVGSPALASLALIQRRPETANKIYFATEPSSYAGGEADYIRRHGISDLLSLGYLFSALNTVTEHQFSVEIVLHPTDSESRVLDYIHKKFEKINFTFNFCKNNKEQVLAQAKVIVGMRSFLLYEASLLNIPVLSLQINRTTSSDLTDDRPSLKVMTQDYPTDILDFIKNAFAQTKTTNLIKIENQWTKQLLQILKN